MDLSSNATSAAAAAVVVVSGLLFVNVACECSWNLLSANCPAVCRRREGPDYDFNGPLLEEALRAMPKHARVRVALLFLQPGARRK
eukprot:3953964-Amphidinium_carterae.1